MPRPTTKPNTGVGGNPRPARGGQSVYRRSSTGAAAEASSAARNGSAEKRAIADDISGNGDDDKANDKAGGLGVGRLGAGGLGEMRGATSARPPRHNTDEVNDEATDENNDEVNDETGVVWRPLIEGSGASGPSPGKLLRDSAWTDREKMTLATVYAGGPGYRGWAKADKKARVNIIWMEYNACSKGEDDPNVRKGTTPSCLAKQYLKMQKQYQTATSTHSKSGGANLLDGRGQLTTQVYWHLFDLFERIRHVHVHASDIATAGGGMTAYSDDDNDSHFSDSDDDNNEGNATPKLKKPKKSKAPTPLYAAGGSSEDDDDEAKKRLAKAKRSTSDGGGSKGSKGGGGGRRFSNDDSVSDDSCSEIDAVAKKRKQGQGQVERRRRRRGRRGQQGRREQQQQQPPKAPRACHRVLRVRGRGPRELGQRGRRRGHENDAERRARAVQREEPARGQQVRPHDRPHAQRAAAEPGLPDSRRHRRLRVYLGAGWKCS